MGARGRGALRVVVAMGENPSQRQRGMGKRVYQVWKGSNVSHCATFVFFFLFCFVFVPMPGVPSSRGRVPSVATGADGVVAVVMALSSATYRGHWLSLRWWNLCAGSDCGVGEARESDCTRLPIGICGVGVQLCWE